MSLTDFNLARVLTDGQLLLGSSGKEYGKLSQLTADELAKAQKDALKNLGLSFGGGADDIGVDVGAELAAGAETTAAAAPASSVASTSATFVEPPRPALPPPRFKPGGAGALPPPRFKPGGDGTPLGNLADLKSPSPAYAPGPVPIPSPAPPPPPPVPTSAAPPPPPPPAAAEPEVDPYAGLSARERNKLKRKRKAEEKAGIAPSAAPVPAAKKVKTDPTPSPASVAGPSASPAVKQEDVDDDSKVVIDPTAKAKERERLGGEIQAKEAAERAEMEVKVGEWPWRGAVDRLAVGLLAPNWETRHGSALGLREILKLQGGGGGMLEGLTTAQNEERHRRWCEDLAAKLLCVFALDRFGDYVSDQVSRVVPSA